jgi:hypothetical protein
MIHPTDLANVVDFLLSSNSDKITGQRFIIDDVVYNNLGIPIDPIGETDVIFSGNRVTIPVTKSHFFKVELEEIPPVVYFINTNCTNGVISPSSNNPLGVSVIENEDILFTITPNNGYTIDTISITILILS